MQGEGGPGRTPHGAPDTQYLLQAKSKSHGKSEELGLPALDLVHMGAGQVKAAAFGLEGVSLTKGRSPWLR